MRSLALLVVLMTVTLFGAFLTLTGLLGYWIGMSGWLLIVSASGISIVATYLALWWLLRRGK